MSTILPDLTGQNVGGEPFPNQSHQAVMDFTQRLFGTSARIEAKTDPEFGTSHFAVCVAVSGATDQIIALDDRWHRELLQAAGESARRYTLSLSFSKDAR